MSRPGPPPLDLFAAPLEGVSLIEASAGTGKTYTITGLYLRLLLEAERTVDRILVVTYTNAATAELRDRIRGSLRRALGCLESGRIPDDFCGALLERIDQPEAAKQRLRAAISGFDEAAIFTIHGFCQRALSEWAFESAMPLRTELAADVSLLRQEIADDFWRLNVYGESACFIRYLINTCPTPERLLATVNNFLGKPYLEIERPGLPRDLDALEQAFETRFRRAADLWVAHADEIGAVLTCSEGLSGNKYRSTSIPAWLASMEDYLGAEAPDVVPFEKFVKFTAGELARSLKKGGTAPEHPFFDACESLADAMEPLARAYAGKLGELQARFLGYAEHELRSRLEQRELQSYDDLLGNLSRALASANGERLAGEIRHRYSAALIDEFQDTDPIQYEIFSRLYVGSGLPVFLVGDPKQAIYGFRGADVFAYIGARSDANRDFTLDRNWRSDPLLVEGINSLFGKATEPFVVEEIRFYPVSAADRVDREVLRDDGQSDSPVRFWFLDGKQNKPLPKNAAGPRAASATAAEIARLLNLAGAGEASIGGRPLDGGDIAVLVRNHSQARLVCNALLELGIPSVQQAQDSVFESPEAEQLERILMAVAEPRASAVRAALATDMLGLTGSEIFSLDDDEAEWEGWLDRFRGYQGLWRDRGFSRMFRQLVADASVYSRLLLYPDGERRLTNLSQLMELSQAAALAEPLGMEGLIKWLAGHRLAPSGRDDVEQLRLESDEHLVKIVTIHKSKGLEYPIVFCPFLWDGNLRVPKAGIFSYHDPARHYQPVLDLGSARQEQVRGQALREELAENLRLLYVALTRARHRCYILWGNLASAGESALGWLLHPSDGQSVGDWQTGRKQVFAQLGDAGLLSRLRQLVENSVGSIRIDDLPPQPGPAWERPRGTGTAMAARRFSRKLDSLKRIHSFSSLAGGHEAGDYADYDALSRREPVDGDAEPGGGIFLFPRGAQAGRCLHWVFEQIDFSTADRASIEQCCRQALESHGFDVAWTGVVADMVGRVLATPLDASETFTLSRISQAQRLTELEFHFPVAGLSAGSVGALVREHAGPGVESEPLVRSLEGLDFRRISGYMKGFVDLIFEFEGRYYILDYKSNWLGNRVDDYRIEQLIPAMTAHAYYLQYLIYVLALHRYLGQRLADYDYERHFGGVRYLFLRGMDPARGCECGVYRDRPARGLIEALDRCFRGDDA